MKVRGLTKELITKIAVPIIIIFCLIIASLSLIMFNKMENVVNNELSLSARNINQEIEQIFDNYTTISEGWAENPFVVKFMEYSEFNDVPYAENPYAPEIFKMLMDVGEKYAYTDNEFYITGYNYNDLISCTGHTLQEDFPEMITCEEEFVTAAMEKGSTAYTDPYLDTEFMQVVCAITAPVYTNDGYFWVWQDWI